MKKNNNYKYSAIFEGKTDKHIFNELKTNIIRSNNFHLEPQNKLHLFLNIWNLMYSYHGM